MPDRRPAVHRATLSRREALLFEAGIKLGGLFHQYLGTPLRRSTAGGLARAIEEAVGLQPYVERVRVTLRPRDRGRRGSRRYSYQYLTAEMVDAHVWLRDGPLRVEVRLAQRADLDYPLMSVESVQEVRRVRGRRPPGPKRARRSVRRGGRLARRTGRSDE